MNSHSAEHNLDIVMCIDGNARISSKWDKISRWDRSVLCSSEKIPDISEFGASALVDFTA